MTAEPMARRLNGLTTIALSLATLLAASGAVASPPNLADAIEEHRRLAAEAPNPGLLNDLGNLLVLSGQLAEAESTYRRVLSMDESNVEAKFNLGLLLQSQGRLESAEVLYEAVLEHDPRHPWAFYQLGTIHEARDHRQAAIESYAQALALDPELYFADVNPQVVSNRVLTEALLRAARLRESSQMAPMQYSRPREITEMLLSLPETPTTDPAGENGDEGDGAE